MWYTIALIEPFNALVSFVWLQVVAIKLSALPVSTTNPIKSKNSHKRVIQLQCFPLKRH